MNEQNAQHEVRAESIELPMDAPSTDVLAAAQMLRCLKMRTPSAEGENGHLLLLSQIPDDLLIAIARHLLSDDEIGTIALLSFTCKDVYVILTGVRAEAEGWRRLRWEPKLTTAYILRREECAAAARWGRTVRRGSNAPMLVGAIAAGKTSRTHFLGSDRY